MNLPGAFQVVEGAPSRQSGEPGRSALDDAAVRSNNLQFSVLFLDVGVVDVNLVDRPVTWVIGSAARGAAAETAVFDRVVQVGTAQPVDAGLERLDLNFGRRRSRRRTAVFDAIRLGGFPARGERRHR